jgi:hypothetical protein
MLHGGVRTTCLPSEIKTLAPTIGKNRRRPGFVSKLMLTMEVSSRFCDWFGGGPRGKQISGLLPGSRSFA